MCRTLSLQRLYCVRAALFTASGRAAFAFRNPSVVEDFIQPLHATFYDVGFYFRKQIFKATGFRIGFNCSDVCIKAVPNGVVWKVTSLITSIGARLITVQSLPMSLPNAHEAIYARALSFSACTAWNRHGLHEFIDSLVVSYERVESLSSLLARRMPYD